MMENFQLLILEKYQNILNEIDVTFEEFIQTCDKFTNKKIFKCDNNGKPIRDKDFNLKLNVDPFN